MRKTLRRRRAEAGVDVVKRKGSCGEKEDANIL